MNLSRLFALCPRCVLLFAAMGLVGCASIQEHAPTPPPKIPMAFKEGNLPWAAAVSAEAQPRGTWWKAFADPILENLVEHANQSNTTIQQAAARVVHARSLARGAESNRAAQLSANANASRQGGTLINAAGVNGTLINTSLNLSYETDFFGRLAKGVDAAVFDAQSREALVQSTQLAVQTDVAQTYFSLRGLDDERKVLRRALADQQDLLDLTERRVRAGLATAIDTERVRNAIATAEADRLTLDRQRAQLEHALAVLVGEMPSNFSLEELPWTGVLPSIPAGIPSTLLARRSDVSAAQLTLLSAQARLGAAQAAWFPSLSLTASGGYASPELSNLFRVSLLDWAVGAALSLPLFDGGRRDAALKGSAAEVDMQYAAYREQVLVAFRDVEDQLSALRFLANQAETQKRVVSSATRITQMSDSRFRNGLANKQEVLDARQNELLNLRKEVQVRSTQFQVTVGLVKALGGSW